LSDCCVELMMLCGFLLLVLVLVLLVDVAG
jgi:hypothetical protein